MDALHRAGPDADGPASRGPRLPGWLVLVLFVPVQVFLFLRMRAEVGWGWAILAFLVIGVVGTRASRAPALRAWIFPAWGWRWERRRHLYQGALLLGAGVTWILQIGPQPWLPAAVAVSLVKSAVR